MDFVKNKSGGKGGRSQTNSESASYLKIMHTVIIAYQLGILFTLITF